MEELRHESSSFPSSVPRSSFFLGLRWWVGRTSRHLSDPSDAALFSSNRRRRRVCVVGAAGPQRGVVPPSRSFVRSSVSSFWLDGGRASRPLKVMNDVLFLLSLVLPLGRRRGELTVGSSSSAHESFLPSLLPPFSSPFLLCIFKGGSKIPLVATDVN